MMAVILLFMPRGLLRKETSIDMKETTSMQRQNGATRDVKGLVIQVLVLMVFLLLPLVLTNRFFLRLATEMLIYGLLAMSLDVLLGFTGLLSFMHAAYMGIAAYTVAIFLTYVDTDASMWVTLPLGVGVTLFLALIIGWLQSERAVSFRLADRCFRMMYYTIIWKLRTITCGDDGLCGLPRPDVGLGPLVIGDHEQQSDGLFLSTNRHDRLFAYSTDYPLSLRSRTGIDPENAERGPSRDQRSRCKLLGWLLACGLAGISGVLFTYLKGSVFTASVMDAGAGGTVLMMTLLGGMGTLFGFDLLEPPFFSSCRISSVL